MSLIKKILSVVWDSFEIAFEEDLLTKSASLSFATLLGLVPLIAMSVLLLNYLELFHLFQPATEGLKKFSTNLENQEFISTVTTTIKLFVTQAEELKGISILGIFFSALLLLRDFELNLRHIIKPTGFSWKNRIELWLLVFILIPLLIGVMVSGVGGTLSSLIKSLGFKENVLIILNDGLGFVLVTLILTLIFYSSSRCTIRFFNALIGGAVSTSGFFFTQSLLEWWILNMPTYSKIYGAFIFIPVFLLYVEFAWIFVLFGACCAKASSKGGCK